MTDLLQPTSTPPSLLLAILDIHPISWSLLSGSSNDPSQLTAPSLAPATETTTSDKTPAPTPLSLLDFIPNLLVFLNAHLASRWGNRVVLFVAAPGKSRLLYPIPINKEQEMAVKSNVYHPFRLLDKGLEEALKETVRVEEERFRAKAGEGLNEPPAIVSAMSKALCYINRHAPSSASESSTDALDTRILVINATPGSSESSSSSLSEPDPTINSHAEEPKAKKAKTTGTMKGGYVGLMNCVFAAQKAKVPIDVLSLPPPSTGTSPPIFLQQASHLTEGVYWRWNGKGGILQYLHTIYLTPPSLRQKPFSVPPQDAVDFRAVCFCHGDVVDVGFVCSVCLSIFCKPLPVCQMCKTKFPIKSLPNLKSLAADLIAIPTPQTIPPPVIAPKKEKKDGGKGKERERAREEIVID